MDEESGPSRRRFAGEVAHELNNALTAVLGLADKLAAEASLAPDHRAQMQLIAQQARRLRDLSAGLAAFSRGAPDWRVPPAPTSVRAPAADRVGGTLAAASPCEETSCVLLVDDEEVVRRIVGWQLQGMGYRVVTAHSAESALEVYDSGVGDIRLALVDVALPGRSGLALAEDLRQRQPDLPVIVLSGTEREGNDSRARPGDAWLVKPVALDDLRRAVEAALAPR